MNKTPLQTKIYTPEQIDKVKETQRISLNEISR